MRILRPYLLAVAAFVLPLLTYFVSADTRFNIENHKGKVVYVDFWASWCIPCRASFPFMQDMQRTHGDSLVIVAINVDKSREDADDFLRQFEVSFNIVYDPQGELAESYDVMGMPSSYLYDREGNLVGSHIGFKKKDIGKLRTAIAAVINK